MAQTVYDRIQTMTKDELTTFITCIYGFGCLDEKCGKNSTNYYQQLLDCPSFYIDDMIAFLSRYKPVRIQVIPLNGDQPWYWHSTFCSIEYAVDRLCMYVTNTVKVDDTTYATANNVYKIIPCEHTL